MRRRVCGKSLTTKSLSQIRYWVFWKVDRSEANREGGVQRGLRGEEKDMVGDSRKKNGFYDNIHDKKQRLLWNENKERNGSFEN